MMSSASSGGSFCRRDAITQGDGDGALGGVLPSPSPDTPSRPPPAASRLPSTSPPGFAGDHGEPIAQYLAVGAYLLPNNLSANAHGNGYADPNLFIPSALESVQVDGGAFNVLEGNHAVNLAAVYAHPPHS